MKRAAKYEVGDRVTVDSYSYANKVVTIIDREYEISNDCWYYLISDGDRYDCQFREDEIIGLVE